jgi:hypothetical protein
MKKITFFLMFIFSLVLTWSCSEKKQQNKEENNLIITDPSYTFTKEDTAAVMDLVNQFIIRMQNKDIRAAVDMFSFLDGDSIKPLSPMFKQRQAMALVGCSGVAYKIERLMFLTDRNNEVKLEVTLFEKPEGDKRPNKTSFYLRPVRFEGQWYLTTKDNVTDTNSRERTESDDVPVDQQIPNESEN